MIKVLITGINGFVGSHLAEHLLSKGCEVSGTVLSGTSLENIESVKDKIKIEYSDVRDLDSLKKAITIQKPQQIYHLAAVTSVAESFSDPKLTFDVNVIGTKNLLDAVRGLKIDPVILLVSSAEIYGAVAPDKLPIKEDFDLKPVNPYAESKAETDKLGLMYFKNYGMRVIRARSFNHTGPRQSEAFVVPAFAKQIAEIEKRIN